MGTISILDCTLRDGGYINDWNFGKEAIDFIIRRLCASKVELIEVGFIENQSFNENRTVFPDIESISKVIVPKDPNVIYVGMIDMKDPINLGDIPPCTDQTIDAIRVIFKQDRVDEGYEYVKAIIERGYKTMVQLVSTNTYSDEELENVLKKFSQLKPFAIYIVDSLGVIKRKQFLKMVQIFDGVVDPDVSLGYHSHNNLQQARGNAEALVELRLERNIIVDATVYGMGRGAGNLNMELFVEYMNEYYGKNYRVEPLLEIIDEYLNDIYREYGWGYSLPFYLSASNGCHPNYAKYYSEKGTLTEKAFNELLKTIPEKDKPVYNKEKAERFYQKYMENYVDDKAVLSELTEKLRGRKILIIGPGNTILRYKNKIDMYINENNPVVFSPNFIPKEFPISYVFFGNMRRYREVESCKGIKKIVTSNITESRDYDYIVNYSSYCIDNPDIGDNSGLMLLKLLQRLEVKEVAIAGLDGYKANSMNYYDKALNAKFVKQEERNQQITDELRKIEKSIYLNFITPTLYLL